MIAASHGLRRRCCTVCTVQYSTVQTVQTVPPYRQYRQYMNPPSCRLRCLDVEFGGIRTTSIVSRRYPLFHCISDPTHARWHICVIMAWLLWKATRKNAKPSGHDCGRPHSHAPLSAARYRMNRPVSRHEKHAGEWGKIDDVSGSRVASMTYHYCTANANCLLGPCFRTGSQCG